jgi:arylsulfatase A-like enzyme
LTRYHLYTPKTVRKWKCRSDPNLGKLITRKGNKSNDYDRGFYSTEYYADNLLRYLRDRPGAAKSKKRDSENLDEDEPFFAFLPFSAPHWPLQCDKADRDNYEGVYDEGPGVLREKRLAKLKELGFFDKDVKPHDVVVDATPEWEKQNAEERQLSARAMECYAGMVEGIDRNCGKVFDYLKSTGEYDST